ncbi:hypothetical protein PV326_013298, partial [Microctonus aethiopoides]
ITEEILKQMVTEFLEMYDRYNRSNLIRSLAFHQPPKSLSETPDSGYKSPSHQEKCDSEPAVSPTKQKALSMVLKFWCKSEVHYMGKKKRNYNSELKYQVVFSIIEIDALLTESSIGSTRSIDRFSPDTMATTASARAAIGAPQLKAMVHYIGDPFLA